ncbi:MAG TPA: glycoside hydrolase family 38 C-terminal domain-containing protein [Planctomycetota bacterium]|jgi:alpha-mannosidase
MTTASQQLKQSLSLLAANQNHMAERFIAEFEFAERLTAAHPDRAASWNELLQRAAKCVADVVSAGRSDQVETAVLKAEQILAPIGEVAKTYTAHCVGHAHIDMNWMWSWAETVATTNDTFTTVLKLMEEFPEFRFSQSQASVYALMQEYNPELFEQIQRRVKEGRWEITAAHWVEGEKNIVSGESLARHLLYTRRYIQENFGIKPADQPIDWEPDTFGHAFTVPGIDTRGGVKYYYMCRPGFENRYDMPLFWWQGQDGSRVLVFLDASWYNDHIGTHRTAWLLDYCQKTKLRDWLYVYGIGDHGGGPTRRDLLRCRDMNGWPIYPSFKFSTAKAYFETIAKQLPDDLPVVNKELNFEFTGCYTTQTLIKKINRYSENYMVEAETAASIGWRVLKKNYPADKLRAAWIDTLFNHFHDILPGSGVRATRDYTHGLFQKIAAATSMIKTQTYRALASRVDTSWGGLSSLPQARQPAPQTPELASVAFGGGIGRDTSFGALSPAGHVADGPRPYVVFNPTAWDRQEVVKVSVWDAHTGSQAGDLNSKRFIVRTPDRRVLPAQKIGSGDYWGHQYVDLAFPAQTKSLGYAAYVVEEGSPAKAQGWTPYVAEDADFPTYEGGAKCSTGYRGAERQPLGPITLENEFLFVEFDRASGGISKLIEKKTGVNLASSDKPTAVLEYVLERPRIMSAWLLNDAKLTICPVQWETFEGQEQGPYIASVGGTLKLNDSTMSMTFSLKAGQPWLEISLKVLWLERGTKETGIPTLRLKMPLALSDAKARYEIPFGSIAREQNQGEEVPGLRWADVSGAPSPLTPAGTEAGATAGCALLNDCKYGHSLDGSTLRLTLIRSSYDPDILPEIGEHQMRMALAPHGAVGPASVPAGLTPADLTRMGAAFNQPLQVVPTDVHKGTLPKQAELLSCEPGNVLVSSIKKAEDERALIVRLYETSGEATTAKVSLNAGLWGAISGAEEVDLLEKPLAKSTAKASKGGFRVSVPAYGIASVKVRFEK